MPQSTPQSAPAAPAAAVDMQSEARQALAAIGRLEDADTALSLAAEGAALYERDVVKLDGYAYCSQAVELAEKGEFRESTRAASKALHVALQTGNTDLLGKAYRDLAIAFSYAGQLERAEQFATLSLKYPGVDPTQVNGPARRCWAMCARGRSASPKPSRCTTRRGPRVRTASARWWMPRWPMR
ncbi:hypothetical protein [Thermomonas carbonis]|uniref:hypothetical protein n=1 Tax=Thermomonas carbonis TaxID=1463158 RepID=UPI001F2E66E4|nr:hypothetical protein [Thermomonas carbonis]